MDIRLVNYGNYFIYAIFDPRFHSLDKKSIVASFIESGFVADLTEEFHKDNGAWLNSLFPKALAVNQFDEGNSYKIKAGIYGVPIDVTNIQMLYNKSLLKKAGIERVKGLVTATDSDADNVYVTLSAKNLRDNIFVVARANTEGSEHKLYKAGADRVLSPYSIGGRRLASLLLRPTVVEFLDVVMHSTEIELIMEEVLVHKNSPFVSAPMADARTRCMTGANILAIKKKGEKKMIATPSPDIIIEAGDRLVVFGTRDQLKELEGLT